VGGITNATRPGFMILRRESWWISYFMEITHAKRNLQFRFNQG
jgi:hypothetical protein